MAYTDQEFLARIKPYIIADMKSSGILASLTAAQAFIESNKGNSGLTQKANNLFGIKGSYNGQSVTMLTTEYYNGVAQKVNAAFRKYPSWAESIADHSAMFNRMSRYANLRGEKNYKTACTNVKNDGYATSPTYTQTLISCIEKYKLYEWDKEVDSSINIAPNTVTNAVTTQKSIDIKTVQIREGSRGQVVKSMQALLNVYGANIAVDGIFGPKSTIALKNYQTSHNLTADGICGEKTWNKLING
jgi:murein L,D-transpeptidase YcbB/YkuD